MSESQKVRVAALADCHYTKSSAGLLKDVFVRASETADVLVLCGDMTDYGLPEDSWGKRPKRSCPNRLFGQSNIEPRTGRISGILPVIKMP